MFFRLTKQRVALLLIVLGLLSVSTACMRGEGLPVDASANLPSVALEPVAEGFTAPLALVSPGDGSGRLFIADQTGTISILTAEGDLLAEPFLDLGAQLVELGSRYDERGLLGLSFHPQFAENGRFFVYYSAPARPGIPDGWNHTARLSEFQVSASDPNRADPDSERVVLEIDQPQGNHNGGQVSFGPDGYLYLGLGDGGGANDEGAGHGEIGNGRNVNTLLGSILRLDVDSDPSAPYTIPADNPFASPDSSGAPEIYAYGLRNPYRFSFDAADGRLFVADVGQNEWEEVNIVQAGGHYGWNIREASHCFRPAENCPSDDGGVPLEPPILEYSHEVGISVTGGFVYRGQALPGLQGHYIFADWRGSNDRPNIFVGQEGESEWSMTALPLTDSPGALNVLAFGEDAEGELYVLTNTQIGPSGESGVVYRLAPSP